MINIKIGFKIVGIRNFGGVFLYIYEIIEQIVSEKWNSNFLVSGLYFTLETSNFISSPSLYSS